MNWHQISLDEVIKIIVGAFITCCMFGLDFIAIYYSWLGHTVKTDFGLTVGLAFILSVLLLSTWWRFVLDWLKKEGFAKTTEKTNVFP